MTYNLKTADCKVKRIEIYDLRVVVEHILSF